MLKKLTIALTGQPNCGKTTMFNAITGSTARVGNYPGITVERMEGYYKKNGSTIKLVDLPGTYSLTSYSPEEIVARDFILNEKPDAVICLLDAVALERSLYLAVQLIELGVPIIIGLNMMDEVKKKGIHIDTKKLSNLLQVPIVECTARKGFGKNELMDEVFKLAEQDKNTWTPTDISYGSDLDPVLEDMSKLILDNSFMTEKYSPRWLAVKYMEEDEAVLKHGESSDEKIHFALTKMVKSIEEHTSKTLNTYPEAIIADYRYGFIQSILKQGVITRETVFNHDFTETVDKALTQRFFGPLIMLLILYGMFWITFNLGAYPQGWLQSGFDFLGSLGSTFISNPLLKSLIVSGIINGVGAVLSFAPLILIMFAMLCFLEDLGYMARVAYMLDKIFKMFGLHGASVMPFIVSGGIPGGCAVPGVMTTRTIRSPKERLATILTAPFMVCGAKTTVFLVLAGAFFPGRAAAVMLIMTIVAWLASLIVARVLRSTIIKGEATPFIMELPPYRLPTLYGVTTHTLDRVWKKKKKAGTIIFGISILMWILMTFPQLPQNQTSKFDQQRQSVITQSKNNNKISQKELQTQLEKIDFSQQETALKHSIAGRLGTDLEYVTKYAGFPWQLNIALIGGFAAKEVTISTLATAYSMGDIDADAAADSSKQGKSFETVLSSSPGWSMPGIISAFIFILLYAPCMATVAAMLKEASWKWIIPSIAGTLILAYVVSVIVFQVGTLLF